MLTAKEAFALGEPASLIKDWEAKNEAEVTVNEILGKIRTAALRGESRILVDETSVLVRATLQNLGYRVGYYSNYCHFVKWDPVEEEPDPKLKGPGNEYFGWAVSILAYIKSLLEYGRK